MSEPASESPEPSRRMGAEHIFTLIGLAVAVAIFAPILWRCHSDSALRESGVETLATIVDIEDTGNRRNQYPEVRIRLVIENEAGEKIPSEVLDFISPVAIPRLRVGDLLRVRYDPESPGKAVLAPAPAEPDAG